MYAELVGIRGYRRRLAPEVLAGKKGKASNGAGLRFIEEFSGKAQDYMGFRGSRVQIPASRPIFSLSHQNPGSLRRSSASGGARHLYAFPRSWTRGLPRLQATGRRRPALRSSGPWAGGAVGLPAPRRIQLSKSLATPPARPSRRKGAGSYTHCLKSQAGFLTKATVPVPTGLLRRGRQASRLVRSPAADERPVAANGSPLSVGGSPAPPNDSPVPANDPPVPANDPPVPAGGLFLPAGGPPRPARRPPAPGRRRSASQDRREPVAVVPQEAGALPEPGKVASPVPHGRQRMPVRLPPRPRIVPSRGRNRLPFPGEARERRVILPK